MPVSLSRAAWLGIGFVVGVAVGAFLLSLLVAAADAHESVLP